MEKDFEKLIKRINNIKNPPIVFPKTYALDLVENIHNLFFFSNKKEMQGLLEAIYHHVKLGFQLENPNLPVETYSNDTLRFMDSLSSIKKSFMTDVKKAYNTDPSAISFQEIILSYPGNYAIFGHRIAHEMFRLKYPLIARMISEHIHRNTAIDIHPGAKIGDSFFIDHGTGVVIGETSVIGSNVTIYHGVTFGVLSFEKDSEGNLVRGTKRHPTIEDNVTVYANSMVLGGNTVIGHDSIIGSAMVVASSIPPYSKLVNKNK